MPHCHHHQNQSLPSPRAIGTIWLLALLEAGQQCHPASTTSAARRILAASYAAAFSSQKPAPSGRSPAKCSPPSSTLSPRGRLTVLDAYAGFGAAGFEAAPARCPRGGIEANERVARTIQQNRPRSA